MRIMIITRSGIRRNIIMWNTDWKKKKNKTKKTKKKEKENKKKSNNNKKNKKKKMKKVYFTVGLRHYACVIAICYRSKTRSLMK